MGNIVRGKDFNKDCTGSVRRFCHSSYFDLDSDEVKKEKAEPEAIHLPGTDGPTAAYKLAEDRERCLCCRGTSRPPGSPTSALRALTLRVLSEPVGPFTFMQHPWGRGLRSCVSPSSLHAPSSSF